MTATAGPIHIDETAVGELEGAFRGEVVAPGHPGYDEHRKIWNGSFDKHPALIMVHGGGDNRSNPYMRWLQLARALIDAGKGES